MEWKVPLFDLNFGIEEENAAVEVIRSKWISMGKKTIDFENKFSEITESKYSIAVNNATAALHLALKVLDLQPGDEVIVPSLTFVATVNAIKYVNATPVFADIKSIEDLTVSPEEIESKITPKTKAVMIMHYGGFSCDMEKIEAICKKHNLYLVEDAAHAPAATYNGKKLGTFGITSAFSFFSNKNISTGEGGMVVTQDEGIAKRLKLLRSHGMTTSSYDRFKGHATRYDVMEIGYNYRMDDIRSAIGLAQLDKLLPDIERRKVLTRRYHENLKGIEEIMLPFADKVEESSNYILPAVLTEKCSIQRDDFRNILEQTYKVQTSVHYPAVHHFSCYYNENDKLPLTDYVTEHEVTLPLYFSMTEEQVDYVCDSIKEIFGRK